MIKLNFDFFLFDVIGTIVNDDISGESLILDCFYKSFQLNGCTITIDKINQQRGKSKREAINYLLINSDCNPELTDRIYSDFIALLKMKVNSFTEIPGATSLFEYLCDRQIKIGLGSGLPKEFLLEIIQKLGWSIKWFNYIGSSEELGKGRPDPIMVFDSMNKLNLHDKSRVLKIGDTIVDILEGKNAGIITASVLTGTQKQSDLEKYHPDFIFSDINELKNIV